MLEVLRIVKDEKDSRGAIYQMFAVRRKVLGIPQKNEHGIVPCSFESKVILHALDVQAGSRESDQSLGESGAGEFEEGGDIGSSHQVSRRSELFGSFLTGLVNGTHDLPQLGVGFLECPGFS